MEGAQGEDAAAILPRMMSDAELDAYCQREYDRRIEGFKATNALFRKPRRKRRSIDYTRRNCEEARGGRG